MEIRIGKRSFNLLAYLEYLTTSYVYFMLVFFPLICGFEGYATITTSKYQLFLYPTLIYLGLLFLFTIQLLIIKKIKLPSLKDIWHQTSLTQIAVVVFLLICCLSAIFSDYPYIIWMGAGRYEGLFTILLYGCAFLGVSYFGHFRRGYIYALAFTVGANCLIALLQFLNKNPFGLYPDGYTYYDAFTSYNGEFLGTIGNVDLFSAFFCLAIPLLACWSIVAKRDKLRWPVFAVACCALAILLWSRVAAGAVGIFGTTLLMLPLILGKSTQTRIKFFLIVFAVILLILLMVFFFGGNFDGTISEMHQLLHGNISDEFGSSRILIWKEVLSLVPEHWLLGGGPDTFVVRNDIVFSRTIEDQGVVIQTTVDTAHNEYLNWLVNCGFLGLGSYLLILISLAWRWIKRSRTDKIVLMLGGGVLCYSIQGFFSFSLCVVAPLFWIMLGLLENTLQHRIELDRTR